MTFRRGPTELELALGLEIIVSSSCCPAVCRCPMRPLLLPTMAGAFHVLILEGNRINQKHKASQLQLCEQMGFLRSCTCFSELRCAWAWLELGRAGACISLSTFADPRSGAVFVCCSQAKFTCCWAKATVGEMVSRAKKNCILQSCML